MSILEYIATRLQPIKSYPTYQLHAFTANDKMSADKVFCICVLETLKWLRLRLDQYDVLPQELTSPEPEDYESFSAEQLTSFNINVGAAMDCTFIPGQGVWSLRITEPDIGENLGTETERLPVNGRTFRTEISFRRHSDNVEIGARTTCSEPSGCNEPCSVFRPAVVRELAQNPDVGLVIEGFRLNGQPLMVTNQTELRNLERLLNSDEFDMPLAIVADSGYEQSVSTDIALPDKNALSFTGFESMNFTADLTADTSKVTIKTNAVKTGGKKAEKEAPKDVPAEKTAEKKQPVFCCERLAFKTLGFAVVCFVTENCFGLLKNKLGISIAANEIIVLDNGRERERLHYSEPTIENIYKRLKIELRDMLKRSAFTYGEVLFYSDARLADLRERRHENISLEDKLTIYKQENSELRAHNRELSQQNTDLQIGAENVRLLQKQMKNLAAENEGLKVYIENSKKEAEAKEKAYRKAAELVAFYRQKAFDTAEFPTDKDEVCDWARRNFSGNIVIAPRAESALRKYSGALDTAVLCDGIYYLNAYAKYRKSEITEEELSLYAESYNWEVGGCGSGALRIHRDDYEVLVDGEKHLLDMHIKYGVSSQVLVRIYFCWDENARKIVIGYMPEHLATASQST